MTSSSKRDELFSALADLCNRYPHWRIGQTISNVAGWADLDIRDLADDVLLEMIQRHLAKTIEPVVSSHSPLRPLDEVSVETNDNM